MFGFYWRSIALLFPNKWKQYKDNDNNGNDILYKCSTHIKSKILKTFDVYISISLDFTAIISIQHFYCVLNVNIFWL